MSLQGREGEYGPAIETKERAGINEDCPFDAEISRREKDRELNLQARAPIFGAAERVALRVCPERPKRYVAGTDAKGSKTANKAWAKDEIVDDPQIIAAKVLQVAPLQMNESDKLVVNVVINTKIASRAQIPRVAARAGRVLAELGKEPARRIFDIVKRIVAERLAQLRCHKRPFRLLDGKRRFAIR